MTTRREQHMSSSTVLLGVVLALGGLGIRQSFGAPAPELTRSHTAGDVTVTVTYLNPQNAEDARFLVLLDTHSVNLDKYHLKNLSLIHDDKGQMYQPKEIESKGVGHHREVTLIFAKPSQDASRIELVIKEIAGVDKRSFRWELR